MCEGLERSRFVGVSEEELDEFTCGICRSIFIDPLVTQCCRQTYCSQCINFWLSSHNTCPLDQKYLTISQLSSSPRIILNLLNNMKIKCDFESIGCKTVIKLNDLSNHLINCTFNPNNTCIDCGFSKIGEKEGHNCVQRFKLMVNDFKDENNRLKKTIEELNDKNKDLLKEIESLRNDNSRQGVKPFNDNSVEYKSKVFIIKL